MKRYVLDTNIISLLIAPDPVMRDTMKQRVTDDDQILGCPMVWHEVLRGLRAKDARRKLGSFQVVFATFEWEDYTRRDWDLAATLWASRRMSGLPIQDGDLLIAAFTLNRNAILVTDNTKDFSGLNLNLENWR